MPSFCVKLIVECLDRDPQRRCQAFVRALGSLQSSTEPENCGLGVVLPARQLPLFAPWPAAWWKWDELEDLLRPLPGKRFVAFFETFDRDLFVISPEDLTMNIAGATHLKEVCDPLGANLVLAATGLPGAKHFQLFLRLLDPLSGQPLREKKLTCALAEITSLPGKAVQAAASLLNLNPYLQNTMSKLSRERSLPPPLPPSSRPRPS
jgi:hypothetical protein